MHDLLEKDYRNAQPDPAFEERMVNNVRRKLRQEQEHRETAWESLVALWKGVKWAFGGRPLWMYGLGVAVLAVLTVLVTASSESVMNAASRNPQLALEVQKQVLADEETAKKLFVAQNEAKEKYRDAPDGTAPAPSSPPGSAGYAQTAGLPSANVPTDTAATATPVAEPAPEVADAEAKMQTDDSLRAKSPAEVVELNAPQSFARQLKIIPGRTRTKAHDLVAEQSSLQIAPAAAGATATASVNAPPPPAGPQEASRKLVRNAQLDLEVKSFQETVDAITATVTAGGGYVDSSNSQKGGNGKLRGTVVVKVLPDKLDAFLLKLRDLGEIRNQSVSTEDVTKAYYDTQARLANSQRMETQLQALLARDNGKVSDLLQVERELGRVRGEIEQMQGELKVYDFQVQYATVTMSIEEKDLNQAAAYRLQERDEFSLFAPDVEAAFAQARQASDDFKAHVLEANLNHNSPNDISALLIVSVPPEQIDGFLAKVKGLGRVENFTRQTQRVANDGGQSDQPADETKTEKDHVLVHISIRSDTATAEEQTQLTVVAAGDIDAEAQQLKHQAAQAGAAVTASNFQRNADGTEAANLSFRLPLGKAPAFLETLKQLGKVESLTVQRNERPDEAQADANAPAEISLQLHNETASEQTQLAITTGSDVDAQAQAAKLDAAKAGAAVTASNFERAPDGTETANLSFRLPLGKVSGFVDELKTLGKVESFTVHRDDQPGAGMADEKAPADVNLNLHNEPAIVADNGGLWVTLRHTFGEGIGAFLGSVETPGRAGGVSAAVAGGAGGGGVGGTAGLCAATEVREGRLGIRAAG